jgi:hypothetical protein
VAWTGLSQQAIRLFFGKPVTWLRRRSSAVSLVRIVLNGRSAGEKSEKLPANLDLGLIAPVNINAYSFVNQHPIVDKARQPIGMKILA